jgi:HEPN domain-containing protein
LRRAMVGFSKGVPVSDDDRTTPMGLFNTAEAFRLSAMALEQNPVKHGHAQRPVHMLYSHAIELYLKALLRTKYDAKMIKKKFGHDIEQLLSEAETFGLVVTCENRDLFAVLASDRLIELRYIETGSKASLEKLNRACQSVRDSVRGLLRQAGVMVR